MPIPDSAIDLAGFALGHALWNVCDFQEEGELLCPLAFTFDGAQKQLLRFEAESQQEAIERGFSILSEEASLVRWAFAREGLFRTADGSVDDCSWMPGSRAWMSRWYSRNRFRQPYRGRSVCLAGPLSWSQEQSTPIRLWPSA